MKIQRNELYTHNIRNASSIYTNRKTTFNGNASPTAMAKAREELLKELDINTGKSVFIQGIRNHKGQINMDVINHFFESVKKIIPLADTVEKLKLLKTLATRIISTKDDMMTETSEMADFLKSDKATDKNVFLLDCAMNYNKVNREKKWLNDEDIDWHFLGSYRPVYDYIMKGTSLEELKVGLNLFQARDADKNDSVLLGPYDRWVLERSGYKPFNNEDLKLIFRTANNMLEDTDWVDSYFKENEFELSTHDIYSDQKQYLVSDVAFNSDGSKSVLMGESVYEHFYRSQKGMSKPSDKRLLVNLDKDNNLLTIQLFNFHKQHKYNEDKPDKDFITSNYRYKPNFHSATEVEEWLYNNVNHNKYFIDAVSYDAKTGIVDFRRHNHYVFWDLGLIEKYKKIDVPDDTEGAFGEKGRKFTFYPLTPTSREMYKMIKGENDNNIIQVLNGSKWAPVFLKLINDGKLKSETVLEKENIS